MNPTRYDDAIVNQPVVIDNGSGVIKAGFAGTEAPKHVFSSIVGRPKFTRVMAGALEGDYFIGGRADENRGILTLYYPMKHGIVENWDLMEKIWRHVFSEMKVAQEEHPVLLTECPLNPRSNRVKAAEVLFEVFNVPAMFVSAQALLALYASGRTTGVVLDSGDGVSHAVPVFEGFANYRAITRSDVAGRDVTERLVVEMARAGHRFDTSAEFEVVKKLKETTCYVAFNPAKEEHAEPLEKRAAASGFPYQLPDGTQIFIGPERYRTPEILFNPSLLGLEFQGVHGVLLDSISKSDLDLRKTYYSNIILSGGSTMFPGFGDRLLNEVRKSAPKDIKIRISAPPERKLTTWTGGSILASLATFKKMLITKLQYDEEGVDAVCRNIL